MGLNFERPTNLDSQRAIFGRFDAEPINEVDVSGGINSLADIVPDIHSDDKSKSHATTYEFPKSTTLEQTDRAFEVVKPGQTSWGGGIEGMVTQINRVAFNKNRPEAVQKAQSTLNSVAIGFVTEKIAARYKPSELPTFPGTVAQESWSIVLDSYPTEVAVADMGTSKAAVTKTYAGAMRFTQSPSPELLGNREMTGARNNLDLAKRVYPQILNEYDENLTDMGSRRIKVSDQEEKKLIERFGSIEKVPAKLLYRQVNEFDFIDSLYKGTSIPDALFPKQYMLGGKNVELFVGALETKGLTQDEISALAREYGKKLEIEENEPEFRIDYENAEGHKYKIGFNPKQVQAFVDMVIRYRLMLEQDFVVVGLMDPKKRKLLFESRPAIKAAIGHQLEVADKNYQALDKTSLDMGMGMEIYRKLAAEAIKRPDELHKDTLPVVLRVPADAKDEDLEIIHSYYKKHGCPVLIQKLPVDRPTIEAMAENAMHNNLEQMLREHYQKNSWERVPDEHEDLMRRTWNVPTTVDFADFKRKLQADVEKRNARSKKPNSASKPQQ